jgi:hypothetical protein
MIMLGRGLHFSASQGAEQTGFSAQNRSAEVEDLCSRAEDVQIFWSRGRRVFPDNHDLNMNSDKFDRGISRLVRNSRMVQRSTCRTDEVSSGS